jgi:acetolactate synthase-1/2/3 large subunit
MGAKYLDQADLIVVVASRVPFYPARNAPAEAKVVVISDNPHKTFMAYQNPQADIYLEGDVALSLQCLAKSLKSFGVAPTRFDKRRALWRNAHDNFLSSLRDAEAKAPQTGAVDPLVLCACLRGVLPNNTIYVDETVTYGATVHQHLSWSLPQSYFRAPTGLGQGFGVALGIKLAAHERPVVLLTGDGSFLYNPILPALGAARANKLPILVVVFNNLEYKSMRRNHLELYPRGIAKQSEIHFGNKIDSVDYAELAKLVDGFGRRVDDVAELQPAIGEALEATKMGRTAILNVLMSR